MCSLFAEKMSGLKRTVSLTQSQSQSQKRFRSAPVKKYAKPSVTQVRSIVNRAIYRESETKMCTATASELNVTSIAPSPSILSCPMPGQGVGTHQRIGSKVKGVGIGSKIVFHNNSSTTPVWIRCSLLEVHNGQMTDIEIQNDLFESSATDSTIGMVGSVGEVIKRYDRQYYTVLKDEVVALHGNTEPDSLKMVSFYKKLVGQEMKFNDAVANLPVGTSRFVWVVYSREGDGDESTGTTVECSYNIDYYFKE